MEFGEILRNYRERRSWSIRALAARAELDPGYVSRVERGSYRAPRLVTVERLARALELSEAEAEALRQASGRVRGALQPVASRQGASTELRNLETRMSAIEEEIREMKARVARLEAGTHSGEEN